MLVYGIAILCVISAVLCLIGLAIVQLTDVFKEFNKQFKRFNDNFAVLRCTEEKKLERLESGRPNIHI